MFRVFVIFFNSLGHDDGEGNLLRNVGIDHLTLHHIQMTGIFVKFVISIPCKLLILSFYLVHNSYGREKLDK